MMALKEKIKHLEKEEKVINKLLDHYENSIEFEGWFPDELWQRRGKNRCDLGTANGTYYKMEEIMNAIVLMILPSH
jgi:hypothetical protein